MRTRKPKKINPKREAALYLRRLANAVASGEVDGVSVAHTAGRRHGVWIFGNSRALAGVTHALSMMTTWELGPIEPYTKEKPHA